MTEETCGRKPDENDPEAPRGAASSGRVVASDELFQGKAELLIQHGETIYRLRITRGGKLILNK